MGTTEGSIIATIITLHMPTNDTAALSHDWPGIRIQAIDMVQSPGISMPPIVDMDPHQMMVTAALAAKSSAETLMSARSERITAPGSAGWSAVPLCRVSSVAPVAREVMSSLRQ
jgi:hypothetical protein